MCVLGDTLCLLGGGSVLKLSGRAGPGLPWQRPDPVLPEMAVPSAKVWEAISGIDYYSIFLDASICFFLPWSFGVTFGVVGFNPQVRRGDYCSPQ